MDRSAAGVTLFDLSAAAKAISKHDSALICGPQPRQQNTFARRTRYLVVAASKPEVAGQSAAGGVEPIGMNPGPMYQVGVGVDAPTACWWQRVWMIALTFSCGSSVVGPFNDHLRERPRLLGRPPRISSSPSSDSGPSERNTAVQDGSSPITGSPARSTPHAAPAQYINTYGAHATDASAAVSPWESSTLEDAFIVAS